MSFVGIFQGLWLVYCHMPLMTHYFFLLLRLSNFLRSDIYYLVFFDFAIPYISLWLNIFYWSISSLLVLSWTMFSLLFNPLAKYQIRYIIFNFYKPHLIILIYLFVHVHRYGCACVMACIWKPKDNFEKSVLSYRVDSGDWTQVISLNSKHFHLLSQPTSLTIWFFLKAQLHGIVTLHIFTLIWTQIVLCSCLITLVPGHVMVLLFLLLLFKSFLCFGHLIFLRIPDLWRVSYIGEVGNVGMSQQCLFTQFSICVFPALRSRLCCPSDSRDTYRALEPSSVFRDREGGVGPSAISLCRREGKYCNTH